METLLAVVLEVLNRQESVQLRFHELIQHQLARDPASKPSVELMTGSDSIPPLSRRVRFSS